MTFIVNYMTLGYHLAWKKGKCYIVEMWESKRFNKEICKSKNRIKELKYWAAFFLSNSLLDYLLIKLIEES
jgi:hypothetical protein